MAADFDRIAGGYCLGADAWGICCCTHSDETDAQTCTARSVCRYCTTAVVRLAARAALRSLVCGAHRRTRCGCVESLVAAGSLVSKTCAGCCDVVSGSSIPRCGSAALPLHSYRTILRPFPGEGRGNDARLWRAGKCGNVLRLGG